MRFAELTPCPPAERTNRCVPPLPDPALPGSATATCCASRPGVQHGQHFREHLAVHGSHDPQPLAIPQHNLDPPTGAGRQLSRHRHRHKRRHRRRRLPHTVCIRCRPVLSLCPLATFFARPMACVSSRVNENSVVSCRTSTSPSTAMNRSRGA